MRPDGLNSDVTRRDALKTMAASLFAAALPAPTVSASVLGVQREKGIAGNYDLLIKGGRVIDPSQNLDAVRDVAVRAGKIADVASEIPISVANRIVSAKGRIVTPGLIDVHAHVFPYVCPYGTPPDPSCVTHGSTTVVDAGSSGAFGLRAFRQFLASSGTATRVRALLNISAMGNVSGPVANMGELQELRFVDSKLAKQSLRDNADFLLGVKVRCSESITGPNDVEATRRAKAAAAELGLPIMMHIGASYSPLPSLLALLEKGDVLTHTYHGRFHGMLDDRGKVISEVLEARARGVIFDVGHGSGNFSFAVAEKAAAEGFLPDTISTDLGILNINGPVYDLATTLSKFLLLGLTLSEVIERATINPAKTFHFGITIGTLKPGAEADIGIFELRSGDFVFVDSEGKTRRGKNSLVPFSTVRAGKEFPFKAQ